MALINPAVSIATLTAGNTVLLYACPTDKSHSIVNINFFKPVDNTGQSPASLIEVALSTTTDPGTLTSLDYFIDDIELSTVGTNASLNRIIVGPGEKLYGKLISGTQIVARSVGIEELNPKVLKAGKLAAVNMSTPSVFTKVFENSINGGLYVISSLTLYNNSAAEARIDVRIGPDGNGSSGIDDITTIFLPPHDTSVISNIQTKPNEKFWIKSTQPNTECFLNGMIVG